MKYEKSEKQILVVVGSVVGLLLLSFVAVGHFNSETQAKIIRNKMPVSPVRSHFGMPEKAETVVSSISAVVPHVGQTTKVEKKRIKLLDTRPLIEAYQDFPIDQLEQEMEAVEEEIEMERFVERANKGELTYTEKQRFSDLLLTLDSLLHVKTDRKIRELETLVQAGPYSKKK